MTELHDQPTPPHGTDRWGEPVFGDGITTGSYVFMPQPGQEPGERDVFQVAFVGGPPGARDELVAFGWRYDAAAEEWEPYWQSVGPGSVPTYRVAGEQQNETPEAETPTTTKPAASPSVVDEVVAALQAKAQALSVEAEEEMRRDLEDQAQVWHEAADLARRTGRKAVRNAQPTAKPETDGEGAATRFNWSDIIPAPVDETAQERDRLIDCVNRVRVALRDCKERGATGMQYEIAVREAIGDREPRRGPGPLCHESDPRTLRECALKANHGGDHEDGDLAWPCQEHQPAAPADCNTGPAAGVRQDAAQPYPPHQWCKCRSCWGWFVEEHPGEDLDELGRDLGWWSGLPKHRDAPAGVAGEQQNETPEAETPTTNKPETDQGAEIERLREQLDEAEDTAEQLVRNIQTVARERDSYRKAWKEEQQRRAQAAAKLRAVAEGLESDADAPGVVEIVRPALRDSARQIRAALAAGVRQDGAQPCAECSHPKDAHREGDDPVTPGTCGVCDVDDPDEAHHDFARATP
ncbi:hypothetical protein [Streptomyces capitiformicae]|uniref:Uncharacterized protein n=1 Tax=Streptomyces capitiformicae TaxID=2014920 RepID=A0A919LA50_9ACTN|nr:hypothetical protein [Streptomyces capitiformicae]GHH87881.1 hypothetical protein GCM10017771_30880 [Streptomyces capitiformicae]